MPKSAAVVGDEGQVLRLIAARYGNALPQSRLKAVLQQNPHLDSLDWSLLVLSIEIELRVSLTPRLLDAGRWTLASFARAVAALPKQTAATHTVDRLTLLVDELLEARPKPQPRAKRQRVRTRGQLSTSPQSGNHAPRRPKPSTRRG
jgi:hypothetical protein